MPHIRAGHVRFAVPQTRRVNPPTTGGVAAPDERIEEMLLYIEQVKRESQLRALTASLSPDVRAQALGGYQDCLLIKEKFTELFVTPLTRVLPEAEEPEGEMNDTAV